MRGLAKHHFHRRLKRIVLQNKRLYCGNDPQQIDLYTSSSEHGNSAAHHNIVVVFVCAQIFFRSILGLDCSIVAQPWMLFASPQISYAGDNEAHASPHGQSALALEYWRVACAAWKNKEKKIIPFSIRFDHFELNEWLQQA